MKVKGVTLVPVTITAPASTATTELRAQTVEVMPDSYLTMEVLNCRVKLMKRLILLNNSKVHRFISDLVTVTEVIPHKV